MEQMNCNSKGPSVHCNVFDYCSGNQLEESHCWEVAQSRCDFHYVFNVCSDCIVYLYGNNSVSISKKDIDIILQKRNPLQDH